MALTWNLTNVRNWKGIAVCEASGEAGEITEALIWASMAIGMNQISRENAREFYTRIRAFEGLQGEIAPSAKPIVFADIFRRIGMQTNATPLTPAAFWKRMREMQEHDANRTVDRFKNDLPQSTREELK